MDKEVVCAKIETLRRCVERFREKTPASAEMLERDCDLQDIICLNLERAIQGCVDLASHAIADTNLAAPATMAESFERLVSLGLISDPLASRMKKSVGFRNIAVHAYQRINWKIVYAIITSRIDDFRAYADAMARAAGL